MESEERRNLIAPRATNIPEDRFQIVYVVFYIMGIGSLLPWNFFITAKKYFQYKLRNTTVPWEDNGAIQTDLQVMFEGSIAVAATLSTVIFNFSTAALAAKIAVKTRMVVACTTVTVVFIVTVCLVKVDTDSWQVPFYIVTLGSIVLLNAGSSVLSASMFGLAGMFPVQYMQAVMSGQAVGGVFAALTNIISIAAGSSVTESAFMYFILATLTSILALAGFITLYFNDFAKFHMFCQYRELSLRVDDNDYDTDETSESFLDVKQVNEDVQTPTLVQGTVSTYAIVLKSIWMDAFGVCLTFFITLTCFPALASSIQSVSNITSVWRDQYFSAVICFLLFNIGDWASRALSGMIKKPKSDQWMIILVLCLLRVGFIPLLILCNAQPRHLSVVFHNDFYPLAFILLLGFTNGYLGTLCMMYGPKRVESKHAEFAGAALSVATTLGLALGSVLGLFLVKWI